MKSKQQFFSKTFFYTLFILGLFSCRDRKDQLPIKKPVDLVNVNMGAISHLLVPTYPTVQIPNSMVRLYPFTTPGINDHYLASRIFAFPVNIPSHRNGPFSTIMADAGGDSLHPASLASSYDHDFETSTPYYYSVLLEDPQIVTEYTVTSHGAVYRFSTEKGGKVRLVIKTTGKGIFRSQENGYITGYDQMREVTQYLYAVSDPGPVNTYNFNGGNILQGNPSEGGGSGIVLVFEMPEGGMVTFKYGISYLSEKEAGVHYQSELEGKSFDELKDAARNSWNNTLGRIQVTGGTTDQQQVFYSSLYRCFERMINITEDDKYFSVFDGKVHDSGGRDFYVDDWSWDTHRTLHPLRSILQPDKEADMINSYIRIYDQSGWMPAFPTVFGDMGAMIGHHQAAIIADAWFKGIRNYDIDKAYEGLRKNAMEGTRIPWREGPMADIDKIYLEKGFFPGKYPDQPETVPEVHSFEGRQSVAVTLEHAFDDWCLSRLAYSLGKEKDADIFGKRGQNYRNVYDSTIGFMAPKDASGEWIRPYNPKAPAGIGGREYFAECNAWTYSWSVQQDIPGLVELMGGREKAIAKLDQLFDEPPGQSKWTYLGYMPDATGLTGLFPMGNEPGFHVPYIYDLLGAPWKSQKRIRQLMHAWFRNDLMGVCGDDDGGAMSAWYVFSAMGFYPFCPGNPVYLIGSPLFDKIIINLNGQKRFTIQAVNVSDQNKYIQSARLNDKVLSRPWFTHEELMQGGELILEMGSRPNKEFGSISDALSFWHASKPAN